MHFYPHGKLTFQIEKNILIIEGSGPWNKEAILGSTIDSSAIRNVLYKSSWVVLVRIKGEPVHTPGAALLLEKIVRKDKMNGRIASAVILEDSNYYDFGKWHIGEIYQNAGETFRFFHNEKSARKWLKEMINIKYSSSQ